MIPGEKVIHPWTPVRTREQPGGESTVEVWGREYRYNGSLFPVSLVTRQTELLAAPMGL